MTAVMTRQPHPPLAPPSLRESAKADKRARIRDAAAALFAERGFDATTTQAVAARAGVAKGTVFLYAPTKVALLTLVFEDRIRETSAAAFSSLPAGAPLPVALDHVFGRFFALYAEQPALARLFVKELSFAEGVPLEARRAVDAEFLGRLAALVEAAVLAGEARGDVPVSLAAANFFGLYLLALSAWLAGAVPDVGAARALLRASIELQIRGLAPVMREESTCSPASITSAMVVEPEQTGPARSAKRGRGTSKRGASATTAATRRNGSR
jgi:TetR/AcrR family transcriptional regulator, cholesterol catabolism regulator